MSKKLTIKINHIDKIEGHAGFVGDIVNGDMAKAKFEVQMGIRLFERILVGRNYEDAAIITARVCGVCPVVHYLTALKAVEDAMGIKVGEEIVNLRKLLMLGQFIQSHSLHTFFMSLSDFFGIKNNYQLVKKFPKWANDALEIRDFGNELIFAIGRRSVHPVACQIGGMRRLPDFEKLKKLYKEIDKIITKAEKLSLFFAQLKYPKFERKTEFIALTSQKEYPIYEGETLVSTEGLKTKAGEYEKMVYETQVDEVKRVELKRGVNCFTLSSTRRVERCTEGAANPSRRNPRESEVNTLMAGALSRINLNSEKLNPKAKSVLEKSRLKLPSYNIFYNIFAQTVEILHCLEETKKLISQCLISFAIAKESGQNVLEKINTKYQLKAGRGYALTEAPRGTLYHAYEIDAKGKITWANIITPTATFINNLEEDLKAYLPDIKKLSARDRERKIKMLIRAYDPCITCSVH